MAITNKVVTVPILEHYKEKADADVAGKYVGQEPGKGLIETEKITKLDGIAANAQVNVLEGVKVNGKDVSIGEDKKVDITADVLAPDLKEYAKGSDVDTKLADYTKTSELADDPGLTGKFLDKETAGTTYATKSEVTSLGSIKGSCEKADLTEKKDSAQEKDIWIVTDDDNHMYYYNGTDFVDTAAKAHVDLGPYLKSETAESTYAKAATVTELSTTVQGIQTTISGLDSTYATDTELSTAIEGLAETYIKTADLQEATEADIDALFEA